MSIQSEINRLSSAKAAIKAVLESKEITVPNNATIDDYDGYVNQLGYLVPTPGDNPVLENPAMARIAKTSLSTSGVSLIIPVAGTYRFKWVACRSSSSGTFTSRLYVNRGGTKTAIGTTVSTWTDNWQSNELDYECQAGDEIIVYLRSSATDTYTRGGKLTACVAQKMFFNSQLPPEEEEEEEGE